MPTVFLKIPRYVYLALAFFIVLNLVLAATYVSPNFKIVGDAGSYHEAIKFLEGKVVDGPVPLHRLLTTPLLLLIASLLDRLVGNPYYSLAAINFIFYVLTAVVFYKLTFEIYRNTRAALLGTILYISNYYIFNADNFFIADLGGRFFFILGNWLGVKYFLSGEKKYFYLTVATASVGVFFKEFGALSLISLLCLIIVSSFRWQEKAKLMAKAIGLFAIPALIFQVFFYVKFGFSYFNWYSQNVTFYPAEVHQYGLTLFLKVMGWVFLAGWPLFVWGLWQEKKFFDKKRLIILAALLPASLTFFAWPMFMQRTAFVLVPWLCLITAFGLSKIKNKYLLAGLVVLYLVVNYNIEYLLVWINLPF